MSGMPRVPETGPRLDHGRELERSYVPKPGDEVHDRVADRNGRVVVGPGVYGVHQVYLRPTGDDASGAAGGWAAKVADIERLSDS